MLQNGDLNIMFLTTNGPGSASSSSDQENKSDDNFKNNYLDDYPKKNAEILSGQYGVNLLLVGISLMLALSNSESQVDKKDVLAFLVAVMLVQLFWMLWYIVKKKKHECPAPEKDIHAGTSWLRGGLTLLAILSLIMDAFHIGYFVGYEQCLSPVIGVFPAVHAVHTISQVYFIWVHVKDIIKTYENFERFGVIHAVFTNLLLWCNGVVTEADHVLQSYQKRQVDLGIGNMTLGNREPYCNCTTKACTIFLHSLYYLYPFNIEYHIFVSVILFVMWKNIGRTLEYQRKIKVVIRIAGIIIGPVMGLIAFSSSIGVLVMYIIQVGDSVEARESALNMFYCYGIIILFFMCTSGSIGLLIYRSENAPMDYSKIPSRKLDSELLFITATGSWLMSWCSIISVISTSTSPKYRWTSFFYSLLLIFEKYIQNLFIIESLHRKADNDEDEADGPITEIFSVSGGLTLSTNISLAPSFSGIINAAFESQERECASVKSDEENKKEEHIQNNRLSEESISLPQKSTKKLNKKRKIVKNIAIFLFMCNISLWILAAFGCRPQYDNGLEESTFGFSAWSTVVNIAMPLNLFYRMHSVASLFEVFLKV
ncbi:proton channel OTOP1 [Erpetoichthys calabaricus]|uniref:Otopetrin 1 n=1 Tax=Erpetoichthys calabaricus TaxID=27687 RepID=A0A8C4RPG1_ERPCA|nr:proton channel OTOP1 [Erpetoichthys calabaricus]